MNQEFIDKIYTIIDSEFVLLNEPMRDHTTFRIGGHADMLLEPTAKELPQVIEACLDEDVPYTILGNGSNVLVGDKGIRGVAIIIGKRMSAISVEEDDGGAIVTAEAGALLSKTAHLALENALTGMEPLAGIPGSVGGAVLMNAGAYGGEVKDVLLDATIYTPKGAVEAVPASELDLSYRHSAVMGTNQVILGARFKLQRGDKDAIQAKTLASAEAISSRLTFQAQAQRLRDPRVISPVSLYRMRDCRDTESAEQRYQPSMQAL